MKTSAMRYRRRQRQRGLLGVVDVYFRSIVSPSFFIFALPSYRAVFAYGTCYFYLNVFHTHAHMQIYPLARDTANLCPSHSVLRFDCLLLWLVQRSLQCVFADSKAIKTYVITGINDFFCQLYRINQYTEMNRTT